MRKISNFSLKIISALTALFTLGLTTIVDASDKPCRINFNIGREAYLQGYIQSLADSYDRACGTDVVVKDGIVYLSNLPNNCFLINHLVDDILKIPGVCDVKIVSKTYSEDLEIAKIKMCQKSMYQCHGVWFPENYNVIWQPLIADPRQPMYSGAYRCGDSAIGQTVAAVSFADNFPIYRWCNLWMHGGELQIGIEGGVFAIFNMNTDSHDLVNADYYVALPLIYAMGPWSFRLRLFHISSHLGDEFLLSHPDVYRTNPSVESLDFFASYQLSKQIRLYAGVGDYFHTDPTFKQTPLYVAYGFELKMPVYFDFENSLKYTPLIAVYIMNREANQWIFDQTYAVGCEIGPLYGNNKNARITIEWHDGFCPDGQLQRFRTSYGIFKLAYDY
jgi:hypothetical protein